MKLYKLKTANIKIFKVIYLVSNSFTHPKNTASSFKVRYNVPFDLTGTKVALIEIG